MAFIQSIEFSIDDRDALLALAARPTMRSARVQRNGRLLMQ
jgi:hypothetical protein